MKKYNISESSSSDANFNILLGYITKWATEEEIASYEHNSNLEMKYSILNGTETIMFFTRNEIIYLAELSNDLVVYQQVSNIGYAMIMNAQKQILSYIEEFGTGREIQKTRRAYQRDMDILKRNINNNITV
jgi:hypothetical protein